MSNQSATPWIKAAKSGSNGGQCVEMRGHAGAVEVRDTKAHGEGPSLRVASAGFVAWVDAAKRGEFDGFLS